MQVLLDDTFPGIHDDHGHFGAFQRRQGLHDRELLDGALHARAGLDPAPAAHARRIDQQVVAERDVDRVARRPGVAVDDLALFAKEPVDQGRLADIGTPHDRHANARRIAFVLPTGFRQMLRDGVGQIRHAPAMRRRHRAAIAETQRGELMDGRCRYAVDLVDGNNDGLAALAQVTRDIPVAGHQTFSSIGNEHGDIRLGDRQHRLVRHLFVDASGLVRQSPGIDQGHDPAGQTGTAVAAVPGQSRKVGNQGVARAAQPIENGRLADVLAAD